ncbi:hypothetical protein QIU18_09505 [Capnocytophaga canimorsus]|nr:hypothetical protein [Capnocytophaga canimorsus]WGU69829.1 hypothetical protein QIU18_09505 [Capnocytophaga canimorsus]
MPYTQSNQPQTPNEGNSEALFSLGKYHYEKYVLSYGAEDFYTAKKYLQILAEQNNDDAQFLLGMLYKTKEGAHSKEAIHWFLQAEQNGVKDATDELNQFHYIKEKAEKGCPESLFQLGGILRVSRILCRCCRTLGKSRPLRTYHSTKQNIYILQK